MVADWLGTVSPQKCLSLRRSRSQTEPLLWGYAVVRQENGAIARSSEELVVGQELWVQLGQGEVKVEVINEPPRRQEFL